MVPLLLAWAFCFLYARALVPLSFVLYILYKAHSSCVGWLLLGGETRLTRPSVLFSFTAGCVRVPGGCVGRSVAGLSSQHVLPEWPDRRNCGRLGSRRSSRRWLDMVLTIAWHKSIAQGSYDD